MTQDAENAEKPNSLRNRLFGQSPFNPFEVISKDGFTMQLEVRLVLRVKPEDAPFMVAKMAAWS